MNRIEVNDDREARRIARGPPSVAVARAEAARVARAARALGADQVIAPAGESSKSASRVLVFGNEDAAA